MIKKYGDRLLDTIESTVMEYRKANKTDRTSDNGYVQLMKKRYLTKWDRDSVYIASNKDELKRFVTDNVGDPEAAPANGSLLPKKASLCQSDIASHAQDKVDLILSAKLFNSLRMLRTVPVEEAGEGINPYAYQIFQNSILQEISKRVPRTKEELLNIKGIGKVKIKRYGDLVLDTIESTILDYQKANTTTSSHSENTDLVKRKTGSTDIDSKKNEKKRSGSENVDKPVVTQAKHSLLPGLASLPQSGMTAQAHDEVDLNLSAKFFHSLRIEADEGVNAYPISINSTLEEISMRIPRTKEELLKINGIGEVSRQQYGDGILDITEYTVREHQRANKPSRSSDSRNVELMKTKSGSKDIDTSKNQKKNSGSEEVGKPEVTPSKGSLLPEIRSLPQSDMQSHTQDEVDLNLSGKLFNSLRMLRAMLVKEADGGIDACHIFKNSTLEEISLRVPRTKQELLKINGICKVTIERHGVRLLNTIESTIMEYQKANKTRSISDSENVDFMKRKKGSTDIDSNTNAEKRSSENVCEQGVTLAKGLTLSEIPSSPMTDVHSQAQDEVDLVLSAKLLDSLCMIRTVLAKEAGKGVYPYHIIQSSTMFEISKRVPRTKEELLKINGISEVNIEKYGDRLLDTIESTVLEYRTANKTGSCSDHENVDLMKRKKASTDIKSKNEKRSGNETGGKPEVIEAKGSLLREMANLPQNVINAPAQDEVDLNLSVKLFNTLRKLRTVLEKTAGENVKACHIFQNPVLQEISFRVPRTKELLKINGISEENIQKYGDLLLDVIEFTVREYQMVDRTRSSIGSENVNLTKRKRGSATYADSNENELKRLDNKNVAALPVRTNATRQNNNDLILEELAKCCFMRKRKITCSRLKRKLNSANEGVLIERRKAIFSVGVS